MGDIEAAVKSLKAGVDVLKVWRAREQQLRRCNRVAAPAAVAPVCAVRQAPVALAPRLDVLRAARDRAAGPSAARGSSRARAGRGLLGVTLSPNAGRVCAFGWRRARVRAERT